MHAGKDFPSGSVKLVKRIRAYSRSSPVSGCVVFLKLRSVHT
jgi:hypothetical protein